MKKIRNRSLIVWLLVMAFIGGMIYFSINLIIHADIWASKPQNAHIGVDGMGTAGTITDINGEVLAYSKDGNRYYNSDADVRCSLLHTVGDEGRNIGGSVQNVYRSQLSGYSFIFGMGLPNGLTLGRNIQLTVNSEICKTAYQALGNNRGAVFVYNYKTGEIVAKVSNPSYDPQNIPDIDGNDEYEGVYVDRSIMATYPPGSTFKLVTASAALENISEAELKNRTYTCTGSDTIGGNEITCYEAHGEENFEQALAHSCNSYFAQLAVDLGADKMTTQANRMGFNKSVSINDINTAKVSMMFLMLIKSAWLERCRSIYNPCKSYDYGCYFRRYRKWRYTCNAISHKANFITVWIAKYSSKRKQRKSDVKREKCKNTF